MSYIGPFKMKMVGNLCAPDNYWEQSDLECTGCGPNDWIVDLVPDNFFLSGRFNSDDLKKCCSIHDYMYGKPSPFGRIFSDETFFENMIRCIETSNAWWWLKNIRKHQARLYYKAVRKYGEKHYSGVYDHENNPDK